MILSRINLDVYEKWVAPRAGAWIETKKEIKDMEDELSRPVRAHGLTLSYGLFSLFPALKRRRSNCGWRKSGMNGCRKWRILSFFLIGSESCGIITGELRNG